MKDASERGLSKPRRPVKLLPDDAVLEVFRLRLAGLTLAAIGQKLGVSTQYVYWVILGAARRTAYPDHPDRLKCVERERANVAAFQKKGAHIAKSLTPAIRLYRKGHSIRAAADACGVSKTRLHVELERRGVLRRLKGRYSPQRRIERGLDARNK